MADTVDRINTPPISLERPTGIRGDREKKREANSNQDQKEKPVASSTEPEKEQGDKGALLDLWA